MPHSQYILILYSVLTILPSAGLLLSDCLEAPLIRGVGGFVLILSSYYSVILCYYSPLLSDCYSVNLWSSLIMIQCSDPMKQYHSIQGWKMDFDCWILSDSPLLWERGWR